MHKLFLFLSVLFFSLTATAQQAAISSEEASTGIMNQYGKIYVVLAVCLVILTGIVLFLWALERRISRLEQRKE